jgi:hypothetical protein
MLTNLNKDEQGNKIERTLGKTKASQAKRRADYHKLGRVRKEDGWTSRRIPSNNEVHSKTMARLINNKDEPSKKDMRTTLMTKTSQIRRLL